MACKVAEQDKGLVEVVGMAVRPLPMLPLAGIRSQNVVEHQEMLISQTFGGLGKVFYGGRVGADFRLGEDCAKLHHRLLNLYTISASRAARRWWWVAWDPGPLPVSIQGY